MTTHDHRETKTPRPRRRLLTWAAALAAAALISVAAHAALEAHNFAPSSACLACHNGLLSDSGEDVSFGTNWRPSMMANAARDPYWHATIRSEILDHPGARAAIEEECSRCHMPMSSTGERAAGGRGTVLAHVEGKTAGRAAALAMDGVSCSACHRIGPQGLGTPASFTGGYKVTSTLAGTTPVIHGPHDVKPGLARVMSSATGFSPRKATHLQRSELCATCHTLFTHALGPGGKVLGKLPEQVPFLEWKHSDYADSQSCQDCHMPRLSKPTAISSVLGQPRADVSRHVFRGGNLLVPRMLNLLRGELGVQASPQELDATVRQTIDHLRTSAARVKLKALRHLGGALEAAVEVQNMAGHKLPTAYPSRRVWLHVSVSARSGAVVFESGKLAPSGAIVGNDNDADPRRYEPHYDVIGSPDQVQIYEPILGDHQGKVTTGLLRALRYLKDNRLPPDGFAKATASKHVAVSGRAAADASFTGGQDVVRYRIPVKAGQGPWEVSVELLYQPIGYRWAENLASVKAAEPRRFVRGYRKLSRVSAVVLASTVGKLLERTAPSKDGGEPEGAKPSL